MRTIYLGGGCFWCTEAVFQSISGVHDVVPGYMGGHIPNPDYEQVCEGTTGHAEVICVHYDETKVALVTLLDIFFEIHDPTTLNRQGNDVGTQYRSIIFYTDDSDQQAAIDALKRAQEAHPEAVIVTEIVAATEFYPAEEYHQNYYNLHSTQPYCQLVISPKLEKFQKKFTENIG